MEKPKILGMKRDKNKLAITIEKNKKLREFLGNLLSKCGFSYNLYLTDDKFYKTDITKFEDILENYKNVNFDIDLIFTHNAVIISARFKNEKQKKVFSTYVDEFCEWYGGSN